MYTKFFFVLNESAVRQVAEEQCLAKTQVTRWSPLLVIRFHCVGVRVSAGLPCINKGVQLKSILLYLITYMPNSD
jgi:hypothetical protein